MNDSPEATAGEKLEGLFAGLNVQQIQAVIHSGGPLIVVAGPGTGKTRVLTMRICHLVLSREVDPSQILAITFTNQAAGEIQDRIQSMLPDNMFLPKVTTFHQWALEFLKGLSGNDAFNPVDEAGALDLLRQAVSNAGVDPRSFSRMAEKVSLARQYWPPEPTDEPTGQVLEEYSSLLRGYGLWDYDDLILEAVRRLEEDADLRERVRNKLPYVLVDEFQDVSPAQYRLVRCLARADAEITVIGDPDQAIYGFRGSSPRFIQCFQQDFYPVTTVRLQACYRCPQVVLDAAQGILNRDKGLKSQVGQGKGIVFRKFKHPKAEARWVASTIEKITGGLSFDAINFGRAGMDEIMSLDSIAVLFRARAMGDEVANSLSEHGIPFQRADRQDPLSALGLLPVHHLFEAARNRNREYHLGRLSKVLTAGQKKQVQPFLQKASGLHDRDLLLEVADFLGLDRDSVQVRFLKRLAARAGESVSLAMLCRNEADLLEVKVEGVRLLSLHAAKGLEFPIVFVVGCDHGVLPWEGVPSDEEQRLFYVGLTRAGSRLYLSTSGRKFLFGRRLSGGPSPFLSAIPPGLLASKNSKVSKKSKRPKRPRQKRLF